MLHGCGKRLRSYFGALALLSGIWTTVLATTVEARSTSIADRPVPVKMADGSTQWISLRDAFLGQSVPEKILDQAFAYFDANSAEFPNQNYIVLIDMSQHSSQQRLYMGNLKTGKVERHHVAHGRGSDSNHDGFAESFSNVPQSRATSLGFYRVAETYFGQHGYSVRMDGLSKTNSNARPRAIVIHGADYVKPGLPKMGRSFGCPALDRAVTESVINRIRDGSLLYITDGR